MRKLIVAAFCSLDGVIQAPGGPEEDRSGGFTHGGWIVPFADETMGEAVDDLFDGSRELLLGRRTYDIFASHWPRLAGDPFADQLNAMRKHVRPARRGRWSGETAMRSGQTPLRGYAI